MYKLIEIVLFIIVVQFLGSGFFLYLLLRELGDLFRRYVKEGVVDSRTLKYLQGKKLEINLESVKSIEGGYERSPIFPCTILLDVNTENGTRKICLDDDEIVKIANTHLNQITISTKWDPDKSLILIEPSVEGMRECVIYEPVGKYALIPYFPNVVGFFVFTVFAIGLYFHVVASYALFVILAIISFIPPFYKQVSVKIVNGGVQITDKNCEQFIPFEEISRVEKKIFRNRIITKAGDIVYFPKACYLLPEFIVEMKEYGKCSNRI